MGRDIPYLSGLYLKHYDRNKKVILEINFSHYVYGKALSQYDDNGVLHPIVFFNKNLISTKCNYNIYDKILWFWFYVRGTVARVVSQNA